jgi:hypothetical protein
MLSGPLMSGIIALWIFLEERELRSRIVLNGIENNSESK